MIAWRWGAGCWPLGGSVWSERPPGPRRWCLVKEDSLTYFYQIHLRSADAQANLGTNHNLSPPRPPCSYQRKASLKYPCNPQVRFYFYAQMLALYFVGFSLSQRAEEAAPSSQVATRGAARPRDPLAHPAYQTPLSSHPHECRFREAAPGSP